MPWVNCGVFLIYVGWGSDRPSSIKIEIEIKTVDPHLALDAVLHVVRSSSSSTEGGVAPHGARSPPHPHLSDKGGLTLLSGYFFLHG